MKEPKFCEVCESEFTPRRSDQRCCSATCRKRAQRTRESTTTAEDEELVADLARDIGQLEIATWLELEKGNALRSSAGQAALMLARRLDLGRPEPGSSTAALIREHRDSMDKALGNAQPVTEDELQRLRRERAERRRKRSSTDR